MSGVSLPQRAWTALAGAAFVAFFATSCATAASSQTLFGGWFERDRVLFGQSAPYGQALPQTEQPNADGELAPAPQRQIVPYPGKEAPGTVIVDTPHTFLYLTLGRRQGGSLRHRRRAQGLHLVGRRADIAQIRMARLDPAGGNDRPSASSAALGRRRPGQPARRAPIIAFTAPTIRPRSARKSPAAASACATTMSSIFIAACRSARR
jgi:hypothetical protein